MTAPYGYWTFNSKCGLQGKASELVETADGRTILVKDPYEPAVLEDEDIFYSLQTSVRARQDFERLFPTLDANSQNRLSTLIAKNPRRSCINIDDIVLGDNQQHTSVTSGIRLRVRTRPAKISTPGF